MTNEQRARMLEIEAEMNNGDLSNYNEWEKLDTLANEEYAKKELPKITKYFNEYIKGKNRKDINDDLWYFYSDWHKDVFGFRPRQTYVLGA